MTLCAISHLSGSTFLYRHRRAPRSMRHGENFQTSSAPRLTTTIRPLRSAIWQKCSVRCRYDLKEDRGTASARLQLINLVVSGAFGRKSGFRRCSGICRPVRWRLLRSETSPKGSRNPLCLKVIREERVVGVQRDALACPVR